MIGAIIQARTSSTRLPGKVLLDLPYGSGITVLQQVVRRLKQSKEIDTIVIATTEDKADDAVVDIASFEGVASFRGSKENVLERYYLAAKTFGVTTVVRITSDCPCIDASVVDANIQHHIVANADYSSISASRTFPEGLDNEVFSFGVLEMAYKNATNDYEKEHVTPYIYRSNPGAFKICVLDAPEDLYDPQLRITIDTEEDYALLCLLFENLYDRNKYFDTRDIICFFREKPWIRLINKRIVQKRMFDTVDQEIAEALRIIGLNDLKRAKKAFEEFLQPM
jgi:spore coat polysaccharide biosynthesis protein SpsF